MVTLHNAQGHTGLTHPFSVLTFRHSESATDLWDGQLKLPSPEACMFGPMRNPKGEENFVGSLANRRKVVGLKWLSKKGKPRWLCRNATYKETYRK